MTEAFLKSHLSRNDDTSAWLSRAIHQMLSLSRTRHSVSRLPNNSVYHYLKIFEIFVIIFKFPLFVLLLY